MSRISISEYRELTSGASATKPPKRKLNRDEESLQRACIEWANLNISNYPDLEFMFHPANGGGRSKAEAGVMKATGVKSGVSDLLLPLSSSCCRGLAIELKSKVGKLSDNQRRWLERFSRDGYLAAVARTLDDFILLVRSYHGLSTVLIAGDFEIQGRL